MSPSPVTSRTAPPREITTTLNFWVNPSLVLICFAKFISRTFFMYQNHLEDWLKPDCWTLTRVSDSVGLQWVQKSAFLTVSQVMWVPLVQRTPFKNLYPGRRLPSFCLLINGSIFYVFFNLVFLNLTLRLWNSTWAIWVATGHSFSLPYSIFYFSWIFTHSPMREKEGK